MITVAALHPLGGIYSVEYERRLSDAATIFIAPRAVYRRPLGQNEGGVGGALGGRWYFAHLAPRGSRFALQPHGRASLGFAF